MWIVRVALRRPYTFVVLAILLLILGPIVILRTPTDIFPDIRIPVIGVVWQYTGLLPDQISCHLKTFVEGRPLDDYGTAVIRFSNGGLGTVTASQISNRYENSRLGVLDGAFVRTRYLMRFGCNLVRR